MSEINDLVKEIHDTAVEKGWWDKDRAPLEIHMLVVSEIAEATEQVRSGKADFYELYNKDGEPKPEGEAVELADAVIRIMDYFGRKGWDLDAIIKSKVKFNKTRGYRHGGKKA